MTNEEAEEHVIRFHENEILDEMVKQLGDDFIERTCNSFYHQNHTQISEELAEAKAAAIEYVADGIDEHCYCEEVPDLEER